MSFKLVVMLPLQNAWHVMWMSQALWNDPLVTVGVAPLRTFSLCVQSICLNLQPFNGDDDVSVWVKKIVIWTKTTYKKTPFVETLVIIAIQRDYLFWQTMTLNPHSKKFATEILITCNLFPFWQSEERFTPFIGLKYCRYRVKHYWINMF